MNEIQQPGRSYRHRYEGPFFRRLLLGGVKWIPRPVQRLTMPVWAGLFYGLVPRARRGAERNLDQVLGPAPEWQRKLRSYRLFVNYAQMLADSYALHLGQPPPAEPVSIGRPHLLRALGKRHGVIALTGHIGMWQLGPFLAEWRELPPFYMAMAEEPNPLVQQFEQRFRDRFRVIYTTESPFSSLQLLTALRQGSIVGIQMDRHTGGQVIPVPFCGRTAWFSTGPATLSRISGAPLVPLFFIVESHGLRRQVMHYLEEAIEVAHTGDREADIAEATHKMVRVYERYVRRYPCQWYNFHDFWERPAESDAARRRGDKGPVAEPEEDLPVSQNVRKKERQA